MRVKRRLQRDTDGLAKVGYAEDNEYHPLPPVEVPIHLKHVATFRTDSLTQICNLEKRTFSTWTCIHETLLCEMS